MLQRLRAWRYALDPDRSRRTLWRHDDAGYADYAMRCGIARDRPIDAVPELVDVAAPERAAELRAAVGRLPVIVDRVDGEYADKFSVDDPAEALAFLEAFLPPAVEARIRARFGSDFLVYWFSLVRTQPGKEAKRSMLWHCDTGPTRHLKLLVYLEDSAASGGNTEFLDAATTRAMVDAGYVFGPVRRRRSDLAPIAKPLGVECRPIRHEIKAGQGVLFDPALLLHRGILPTRGPRHVAMLCLLPSPAPWRDAWRRAGQPGIDAGYKWLDRPQDLADRLGAAAA